VPKRVVTYDGPKARGEVSSGFQVEVDGKPVMLTLNDPVTVEQDVADAISEAADSHGQNVTVETEDAHKKRVGSEDDSGDSEG
jgi:hypothetical protein